jgi:hypothetical protein
VTVPAAVYYGVPIVGIVCLVLLSYLTYLMTRDNP